MASGASVSEVALSDGSGRPRGGAVKKAVLAQVLNVRFWQISNVRFFEAADQHAGPSATTSLAKPVGCRQPTGSAPTIMRLGGAVPRKRYAADTYTFARSLGGTLAPGPPPMFSLGMSWPRWKE